MTIHEMLPIDPLLAVLGEPLRMLSAAAAARSAVDDLSS